MGWAARYWLWVSLFAMMFGVPVGLPGDVPRLAGGTLWAGEDGAVATPEQAGAIKALIAKLNAADALAREDAERELLKQGGTALPLLREAVTAPEPEIAARAKRLVGKLTEKTARPTQSYSDILPANSIFFLEAPHSRQTLDKIKDTPLGKFWDSPPMKKFYKGHYDAQVLNDSKVLDAIQGVTKVLDGKVLFALGAPETAEAAELDPPIVYVLESKQPPALEKQIRDLFDGRQDPAKATRRYGPFNIEEHINAQTVFGDSVIHALTQKAIESFLDSLLKRPEKPLTPALSDIRALLPQYDFVYHIGSAGFKDLADAGQLLDDEIVGTLDKLGFVSGSTCQGVVAVTPDGFEEYLRIALAGGEKNEGLLPVLRKAAANVTAAPPNTPDALDLIPWQAGVVLSLRGDFAGNAAALAKAIRALDGKEKPAPPQVKQVKPVPPVAAPGMPPPPGGQAAPPAPKLPPNPLDQPAKGPGNAGQPAPNAPAGEKAPPAEAKPEMMYPGVEHIERAGLKLEQFLEQLQGPVHVALFPHQIEADTPDDLPMSLLAAFMLKDPKPLAQALDTATAGPNPRFTKEALNEGVCYVARDGDPDARPGFWLKGNYLAYATERDLLELAGVALAHRGGNDRIAERPSYKQALAQKQLDPQALFTIFGDADQVLEMPYKLARTDWQEDDKNPWPEYDFVRALLQNKTVVVRFNVTPDGIQGYARTPLTLFGMIEAFRRPLIEANFW